MTTRIKGTGRNSFRQQRQISSSSFGGSGDDGGIYRGNSRRRYFSVLPSSPSSQSSLSAQSPVATSPALIRLLDSRSRSTCSYSHCYRYSSSFSTSSSSTSSAQQASLSSSSAQQPKSKSKNKNKSKKLRSKKRKPYTNSNGNNSNHSLPKYKVAKISDNGEKVQFEIISIIELLKKVHARDLYSLALTSIQEYEFKTKNKGRITGSTRSLVDGHTNTRRNKRSSNTVISPRKETILISFGSIRAVIGLGERYEANQRNEILDINRHESVELLLEEYSRQLSNILAETIYLLKKVQNKQELVAISLDSYRNRIIRMNLYLSIAGISIAYMTTIAGFYGMNIINGHETSVNPYMFTYIVSGTTMSGFLLGIGCYTYIGGNNGASHTRYKERLHEIEIIDGALNKMGALDYTMKYLATMEDNNDNSNSNNSTSDTSSDTSSDTPSQMTRDEFKRKLYESQGLLFDIDNYNDMGDDMNTDNTEFINDKEVDLLFNSLDVTNDGYLNSNDFSNNSNSHTQHFR
ncbi:hypothetical protein FRACYDRAFT_252515 [Fragilariopsis cylindrus CCMP1102]|uniref:Uncharacterized protein n=1 Tax=Fragilariopsis cylindrus CCMP1102 TaxID=635003 RepID=A0A1E7ELX0_9STRA|nr:hypothetical protein FRACYDRAFT_252515 [Fragilariopsis cylindrus CCMP1102]|eukprot:OEU06885.1 hypothetical protein FRACYDRAFT_252515 [Fragilariopsis cylindrus CCMP1102]